MGGPAGSIWNRDPDADWAVYILSWMFSICAGAEHPLFLWKSDRISGGYPAAFGNLPVEKEKTEKKRL